MQLNLGTLSKLITDCSLSEVFTIDLSNNKLTGFEFELGDYLINLNSLDLHNNQLTTINRLLGLNNLAYIDLSNNLIGELTLTKNTYFINSINNQDDEDVLNCWKKLKTLILRKNKLVELPLDIRILTNLVTLNVSNNQLNNNYEVVFKLKNLVSLDLSFNDISRVPKLTQILNNLNYLNLAHNKLVQFVDLKYFPKLKQLLLNNNKIINLDISITKYNRNLTTLNLSHNRLINSKTNLDIIKELKLENTLKTFNLEGNSELSFDNIKSI